MPAASFSNFVAEIYFHLINEQLWKRGRERSLHIEGQVHLLHAPSYNLQGFHSILRYNSLLLFYYCVITRFCWSLITFLNPLTYYIPHQQTVVVHNDTRQLRKVRLTKVNAGDPFLQHILGKILVRDNSDCVLIIVCLKKKVFLFY